MLKVAGFSLNPSVAKLSVIICLILLSNLFNLITILSSHRNTSKLTKISTVTTFASGRMQCSEYKFLKQELVIALFLTPNFN